MERSDGKDFKEFTDSSSGALFDASRYEFFGQHAVEEVELGGLEDEGDNLVLGPADDEYRLFDRDETTVAKQLL